MKKSKANQRITLLTLVVALGAAVYLNWEYAKTTDLALDTETVNAPTEGLVMDALETDAEVLSESADTNDAADKTYGEAQLVSVGEATGDTFFQQARLDRTKTRDEALDKLQKSLKKAKLSDEEKEATTKELTDTISHITAEGEIESLVKAKGFVDCVVFIDSDQVNVTVMTTNDGLAKEEVAQIRDIVLAKCEVRSQDITIVEVK